MTICADGGHVEAQKWNQDRIDRHREWQRRIVDNYSLWDYWVQKTIQFLGKKTGMRCWTGGLSGDEKLVFFLSACCSFVSVGGWNSGFLTSSIPIVDYSNSSIIGLGLSFDVSWVTGHCFLVFWVFVLQLARGSTKASQEMARHNNKNYTIVVLYTLGHGAFMGWLSGFKNPKWISFCYKRLKCKKHTPKINGNTWNPNPQIVLCYIPALGFFYCQRTTWSSHVYYRAVNSTYYPNSCKERRNRIDKERA